METYYTAYTKFLDFKTYYFVKKYNVFPEYKDVPPIMESYGMHTDFEKACSIAGITDPLIREKLFLLTEEENIPQAKVVDLNNAGFSSKTAAG